MSLTLTAIANENLPKTPQGIMQGKTASGDSAVYGNKSMGGINALAYSDAGLAKAASGGTLTQEQADSLAAKIFKQEEQDAASKMAAGYVSPAGKWLDWLDKGGYEYKKVTANGDAKGIVPPIPAHGLAVKKASAVKKPSADSSTDTPVEKKEESKFPTWGYAAIGVGVLAVGAGAYWFFVVRKAGKK